MLYDWQLNENAQTLSLEKINQARMRAEQKHGE